MKKNSAILATLSLALVFSLGFVPNLGTEDSKSSTITIIKRTDDPRG
ncbi:hypothetical protein [Brevibacillus sp. SYSU BS000544]